MFLTRANSLHAQAGQSGLIILAWAHDYPEAVHLEFLHVKASETDSYRSTKVPLLHF